MANGKTIVKQIEKLFADIGSNIATVRGIIPGYIPPALSCLCVTDWGRFVI